LKSSGSGRERFYPLSDTLRNTPNNIKINTQLQISSTNFKKPIFRLNDDDIADKNVIFSISLS
jgi:hypothetical protein